MRESAGPGSLSGSGSRRSIKHIFSTDGKRARCDAGDTHLSPLGWETMFGATVDCTGEEPIYAGYHQISHDDKVLGCYFGQINDPAIETVVISIQQEEYDQEKAYAVSFAA